MAEFALRARAGWWGYNSHPHVSTSAVRIAELGRRILPEPFFMKLIRFMDFRAEDDVFPTYHRANTCADLDLAARQARLSSEMVLLVPARPIFYFVALLCAGELAASRLLLRPGAERFAASVILGVYRKPTVPAQ